jgi:hypothetical protein
MVDDAKREVYVDRQALDRHDLADIENDRPLAAERPRAQPKRGARFDRRRSQSSWASAHNGIRVPSTRHGQIASTGAAMTAVGQTVIKVPSLNTHPESTARCVPHMP